MIHQCTRSRRRAGVVSVFRREPLATDEFFNFAVAQFDREAAHPLPPPLAMLAHAGGRRLRRTVHQYLDDTLW